MAKDVNLVIHPPTYGGSRDDHVLQDGQPVAQDDAGDDVVFAATVRRRSPSMRRACTALVANRDIDRHELTLSTKSDGIALYAFTFGSSCVEPG